MVERADRLNPLAAQSLARSKTIDVLTALSTGSLEACNADQHSLFRPEVIAPCYLFHQPGLTSALPGIFALRDAMCATLDETDAATFDALLAKMVAAMPGSVDALNLPPRR